nr:13825_t:CDS:2 [Entrophospora candida]
MSPILTLTQKENPQRVLRQMMNLCRHIYSRGLVDGSGSDVTIKAFGKDYLLHRIILYQNPYFSVLLEGPWKESGQKAIELKFDDVNITREAFEIALGRLYGRLDEYILPNRVLNLLATASFLDLQDLCEMCVEVILRDIKDDTVVHYLTFATTHFYGSHSEKITESCFTYLCREGYDNNKLKAAFLTLPVEWLKKIIESDAFWVPSEYERYLFTRDIVSKRRQQQQQQQQSNPEPKKRNNSINSINSINSFDDLNQYSSQDYKDYNDQSVDISNPTTPTTPTNKIKKLIDNTFNYHTRRPSTITTPYSTTYSIDNYDEFIYNAIFTYAIYYAHMTFEELNFILRDRDTVNNNAPFAPDYVAKDALWQQIDLRNKIENTSETDLTIGISSSEIPSSSTGVHFEIPSDDTTHIGEAVTGLEDMIGSNGSSVNGKGGASKAIKDGEGRRSVEYSLFAPFRFSVEFTDVAKLKEKQRVYSATKFYAGSNWNMYIQKIKTPRKGIQLGVYLHRHSMPDMSSSCVNSSSLNSSSLNSSSPTKNSQTLPGSEERFNNNTAKSIPRPNINNKNNERTFSKYADKRENVRTWFKIFCPSRGPSHVLTQFQSSPDNFALMQSWGWRSSSLCQDDYLMDVRDYDNSSSISNASSTLKFSVVMGHV